MIKLLLLLPLIITLTSCNCYQVSITGNMAKPSTQQLYFENDSLKVEFVLSHDDSKPIFYYTITNKLTQPIYIDWKNTTVNFDSINYSYYNPYNDPFLTRNFYYPNVASIDKPYDIILPQSTVTSKSITVLNRTYIGEDGEQQLRRDATDKNNKEANKNALLYTESTTPKGFKLLLATSHLSNLENTQYQNFKFWINNITYFTNRSKFEKSYKFSTTSYVKIR